MVHIFCNVYSWSSPLPTFNMAFEIGSVLACLIIFVKFDLSPFPWKDIVSIPNVVVCTFVSCESLPCLRLQLVFRSVKISFMKGLKPDLVLKIPVKQAKILYVDRYQIQLLQKRPKICSIIFVRKTQCSFMDMIFSMT